MVRRFTAEPWRIKVVEPLKLTTYEERIHILKEACYNVFAIKAEDNYVDLLTDSGVTAMSDNQWAGLMLGDESYAGCKNFFSLQNAVRDIFGFPYILPAHQGRAAENVFFRGVDIKGKFVVGNGIFDTTIIHIENKGGIPVDMLIAEGDDIFSDFPFKGNMDTDKLRNFIKENGADNIAMVELVLTCNNNGGQPVSMSNIKEVSEIAKANGIKVYIDAARYAENAFFIQEREKGYGDKSCFEIAREMFSYSDFATMSSKKTGMVNMGGFIACKDEEQYQKFLENLIAFEGFYSYGGLAGRDLEALARGLYEGIDDNVLAENIRQVHYLGKQLVDAGIPINRPFGGHGIYMDALTLLPNIPRENFPGETFVAQAYLMGGVRGGCLGRLAFGDRFDPDTGERILPKTETIRYAVPRRMYTDRHMDVAADAIIRTYRNKDFLKGLRIVHETPTLKNFLSRFEPL